jgi:hypothetical protein
MTTSSISFLSVGQTPIRVQLPIGLPNPSALTTHGIAQPGLVQKRLTGSASSHPKHSPSPRIALEEGCIRFSNSFKRLTPSPDIALASAFISGFPEWAALSSSFPASFCPNLRHMTPQRNIYSCCPSSSPSTQCLAESIAFQRFVGTTSSIIKCNPIANASPSKPPAALGSSCGVQISTISCFRP